MQYDILSLEGTCSHTIYLTLISAVTFTLFYYLGMEAIWKVEVQNFPAFIVVDNKGNDFFKEWQVE